ncbi:MAG: alanyl-tRNA editing protein [Acidobacteriaceae bacterium]|nr:alanyl-tRNA editing protein [Acidobacteriaceae bacterium]
MTERLYYSDCYLDNFEATVTRVGDGGRRVYLDRTAFYPASGGQPFDTGAIGDHEVVEVVDEGECIAHVLSAPFDSTGAVRARINWERRFDHMQQHTGQHLLSAVWNQMFAVPTVSFHLGPEASTIELGAKEVSPEQIAAIELRVAELVAEARTVEIGFEEAERAEGLRKPSARVGALRVVSIAGLDRSACGGTHVRSTAEIGPVQMRRTEKLRGNVRVEFVCGARAVRRARRDFLLLAELSRIQAAAIDDLPSVSGALRERMVEADKERQRLAVELARSEGAALFQGTAPSTDGIRRVILHTAILDDGLRAKAQSFVASGKGVVLAIAGESGGVLVACSPDSGYNAGIAVKTNVSRGGGSAILAQGTAPDTGMVSGLKAALGFSA